MQRILMPSNGKLILSRDKFFSREKVHLIRDKSLQVIFERDKP
jgi:hypothetical protein